MGLVSNKAFTAGPYTSLTRASEKWPAYHDLPCLPNQPLKTLPWEKAFGAFFVKKKHFSFMANMNKGQGNGFILALHCLSGCFFLHYKSGAVWDDSTLPLCAWNFSMSPFVSNNLITRGSPGPCEASSFGRSQKQHLVSISELRLQQEPEVSASPGSKITSTVCKGQSHLRHLELYARFFFFFLLMCTKMKTF